MESEKETRGDTLASRIVSTLAEDTLQHTVAEVRIGLGYTAVKLADESAGVAFTFRQEARGGCSVFHALRPLVGRPASDLLQLLQSTDRIEAAVGLACANALANRDRPGFVDGDIIDSLDIGSQEDVGMVGHFGPLVDAIESRARSLTVFEKVPERVGRVHPEAEAATILPRCQVAIITGTSIINHTIDDLLESTRHCRVVTVLGASTPLLPEAFAKKNVTILSGVVVQHPDQVLRVVAEGGGMRLFKPYIRKVNLVGLVNK